MEQKTAGLIKIWAIVVGILSLSSLWTLGVYPILSPIGLFSVVAIVLGLAVAYAGIQVSKMASTTVIGIFWTKFGWLVLNLLLSLFGRGDSIIRLIIIIAQGIIVWFLVQCMKKMPKREAK